MNLRHLQQFIAVAETGSFRKAALQLHVAQPPLSVAIRRLERQFDGPLFERSRQGIALTPLGHLLLDDARQAVFHAERMRETARHSLGGVVGTLRIGFVGSATYTLFPRALPLYRERFPLVELDVRERTTTQILRDVEEGRLDVGLVRYPVLETTSARLEPVEHDVLVVALPTGHPLLAKRKLALAQLADQPFIMYSSTAAVNLRGVVVAACQSAGFTPTIVQEAVQVQTVVSFVESRLGIALVPSVCCRHVSTHVAFRPLVPKISVAIALAIRRLAVPDVALRFRELLRGLYGQAGEIRQGP